MVPSCKMRHHELVLPPHPPLVVGDALLVGRVDALEADWDLSCPVSAPKRVPCGQGLRSRLGMGNRARIKPPIPEH